MRKDDDRQNDFTSERRENRRTGSIQRKRSLRHPEKRNERDAYQDADYFPGSLLFPVSETSGRGDYRRGGERTPACTEERVRRVY